MIHSLKTCLLSMLLPSMCTHINSIKVAFFLNIRPYKISRPYNEFHKSIWLPCLCCDVLFTLAVSVMNGRTAKCRHTQYTKGFFWIPKNEVTDLLWWESLCEVFINPFLSCWCCPIVDDPLDTVAIHLGGGLWGLISASIFSNTGLVFGITRESLMVRTTSQAL